MAESASVSSGIAARYAQAVFDLAREAGGLDALESDVAQLEAALGASEDLRALIASPVLTREEQARGMAAVADRMGLSPTVRNVLGLMAQKRRLFVLPQMLAALRARLAEARGEVEAEVVSAQALSPEQEARLARSLAEREGRKVRLRTRVDASLIGGLQVTVGSRMVDATVKAKLDRLQNIMREAR